MRAKQLGFIAAMLFAAAASGQTVSQVLHFTYVQSPVEIQEITNMVRSLGEIPEASPNAADKTLTVSGTPAQLAMASWIFTTLDQPAPANHATQEYRPAGSVNDVVRILYLTQPHTPRTMQEIVNAMRTIPEITKLFPDVEQRAVALRGTELRVNMSEWLFHQLDLPPGVQPVQSLAAHQYLSADKILPQVGLRELITNDQVQVLFLTHEWTPESMQEIVNAVRTIPELTKVFPCADTGAISMGGLPATLALATWLFNQLDQAAHASRPAAQEFHLPGGADDVTKVFFLDSAAAAGNLTGLVASLRTSGKVRKVFPNTTLNAVTIRGTAAQIAAADLLMRQ